MLVFNYNGFNSALKPGRNHDWNLFTEMPITFRNKVGFKSLHGNKTNVSQIKTGVLGDPRGKIHSIS